MAENRQGAIEPLRIPRPTSELICFTADKLAAHDTAIREEVLRNVMALIVTPETICMELIWPEMIVTLAKDKWGITL